MNRREFGQRLGGAVLSAAFAKLAVAQPTNEKSAIQNAVPEKPQEIAMLIYPGMTALDLIGPNQVFGYLGGTHVELVAKTNKPIVTDTGITIQPSKTFADCADPLDILFVGGGGPGTVALMTDTETLDFLSHRGKTAKLVTSVCTGSLVLAAAGLLRGYKATSHWVVRDILPLLGAELVVNRVVKDRNRITAGGITAGIDFGLRVAAELRGEDVARLLELTLEYDPQPPFGPGTPEKAPPRIEKMSRSSFEPLHAAFRDAALAAKKNWAS
ncbi:MAG TPA: DJ-1/PfpI family protein [Candidatus Acidoferrales bacterium]|nr:DJ-1/PfpI family protein [Candidatus Acidoferrales bacterium]